MSAERNINDLILHLSSTKKKERVNALETVSLLVHQEAVADSLTDCSNGSSNGISWNTLFLKVHGALQAESGTKVPSKLVDTMRTGILSVVQSSSGHLETNSLVSSILFGLSSDGAASAQSIYYELTTLCLLQHNKYSAQMKSKQWHELMKLCLAKFEETGSGCSTRYLDIINKILTIGQHYALRICHVQELLPFLQRLLLSPRRPANTFDWCLLLLTNEAMRFLAAEDRYTVVDFTEATINSVLGMYELGKDKNQLIFRYLNTAINLHHPKGADPDHPLAYAGDWPLWKRTISEIHEFCELELREIMRSKHIHELNEEFLNLLADVIYLMSFSQLTPTLTPDQEDNSSSVFTQGRKRKSIDSTWTQSLKRPKMELGLVHILNNMNSTESWFWLKLLSVILEKHPKSLMKDRKKISEIVCNLLCESREIAVLEPLSKCTKLLLDQEEIEENAGKPLSNSSWEKVAETIIRYLAKDNLREQHAVLQSLIKHSKWKNFTPLLELYLSGNITATSHSLQTLIEMLNAGVKTDDTKRLHLLRWCLEKITIPKTVVRLLLLILGYGENWKTDSDKIEDENWAFTNIYDKIVFTSLDQLEPVAVETSQTCKTFSVNQKTWHLLKEILLEYCHQQIEKLQSCSITNNSLYDAIQLLETTLLILSQLQESTDFELSDLTSSVGALLRATVLSSVHLLNSNCLRIELFSHLYSCDFHPEVHQIIRQNAMDVEIVKSLYCIWERFSKKDVDYHKLSSVWSDWSNEELYIDYTSDFQNMLNSLNVPQFLSSLPKTGFEAFLVDATETLCQFIKCPGTMNNFQKILATKISNCLASTQHSLNFEGGPHLYMVLRMVYCLGSCAQLPNELQSQCLDLLLLVSNKKNLHYEVLPIMLSVLRTMLPIISVATDEVLRAKYRSLLERHRTALSRTMVARTIQEYIKLLSAVSIADRGGDGTLWLNSSERIDTDMLPFLTHNLIQIRFFAAETIADLFSHVNHTENEQRLLLNKLYDQLIELSTNDNAYLKKGNIAVCSVALSKVFCADSLLRPHLAFVILKLIVAHQFSSDEIKTFLKLLSSNLKVSDASKYFLKHLKSLFVKWIAGGYHLRNFPYGILQCCNCLEFYSRHLTEISVACAISNKIPMMEDIAENLNFPVSQIIESTYSHLKAFIILGELSSTLISDRISGKPKDVDMVICLHTIIRYAATSESMIGAINKFNEDQPFFLLLATSLRDITQKVLLLLEGDIVSSVTLEDFLMSFNKYICFVNHYMDVIQNVNEMLEMNTYLMRDAFSVILRSIRTTENLSAIESGCECIRHMLDVCPTTLKKELIVLLPGVVSSLASITTAGSAKNTPIIKLLNYILNERRDEFSEVIERLDPFPDEIQFANFEIHRGDIRLLEELKQFSEVIGHSGRRIGGLSRLLRCLSSEKEELRAIYDLVRGMRGFSEDCTESVLHKVIDELVNLCSHSDVEVRTISAKCLGEFGAADLTTLVLKPPENAIADHSSIEVRLVDTVMTILGQMVQQEAHSVKTVASEALYAVMRCDCTDTEFSYFYAPFMGDDGCRLMLSAKTDVAPPADIWMPDKSTNHEQWIICLVRALLNILHDPMGVCHLLDKVCEVHAVFAERILPLILNAAIGLGSRALIADISRHISAIFQQNVQDRASINLKSVRCMVEAVDYFRFWSFRAGTFKCELDVDLLLIAEAASNCEVHFTSLLFAELWFEEQRTAAFEADRKLLYLSVDDLKERRSTLSAILRNFYASVGIQDGLHGCGTAHLANGALRALHLEQLGRWDLSILTHDYEKDFTGETRALKHFGMYNTLSHMPLDVSAQLECAARLGNWSLDPPSQSSSFSVNQYSALKAFHDGDMVAFNTEVHRGINSVVAHINDIKVESTKNLYEPLSRLQCLKEFLDFADAKQNLTIDSLCRKWEQQDLLKPSDFNLQESVLTSRCIIVREELKNTQNVAVNKLLSELYLRLCKISRKNGKYEIALRNVFHLNEMKNVSESILLESKIEEAGILWDKGEQKIALFLLATVLNKLNDSNEHVLQALSLRIYGNWLVERKSENSRKIIEDYFLPSLHKSSQPDDKLECYYSIARCADASYCQLKEYFKSSNFGAKRELIEQQITLASRLKENLRDDPDGRDKRHIISIASKQSDIDSSEVNNLEKECHFFLKYTIRFYMLSLQGGDKFDHSVFRLVSLWLENCEKKDILPLIKELLPAIPSHKFLCVLPQIAPRMSDVPLISEVVERALKQHPHHTMPVLFALKNSYADQAFYSEKPLPMVPRVKTATVMLHRAARSSSESEPVHQMTKYTEALIEFANLRCDKSRGSWQLPQTLKISRLKDLNHVLDPTVHLNPSPNCSYPRIVGIQSFSSTFDTVGGVNNPKKIVCIGTDGRKRTLLVKGRDDLRQDAVMQQVFGIMNELLLKDEETSRHKLVIRTYRVQPLSQRSGIIEWCENTQPIGQFLVGSDGNGGAHRKYNPNDMLAKECRRMLQGSSDAETRLRLYLDICKRFHPAFHYFFFENFPTAGVWFERRLAYIRSVATNSMIGYVLGIGDRHVMNILIDNKTAEAIHIDLGIAFEQGKTLPTPETVPFRLTRDIEAAMGCSGVDGVFRLCCERTMAMLRASMDTIHTLLEVLLHDPLYAWAITPEKAMSIQSANSETSSSSSSVDSPQVSTVNAMAERALVRLKTKLTGTEYGGVVSTVEGQVSGLIQQARDPVNLSRLFAGWQPYL